MRPRPPERTQVSRSSPAFMMIVKARSFSITIANIYAP